MIQLFQGDCLELMNDIPDKSVDMILCDLPYGITQNKWDKKIDLYKLFPEYERIVKSGGVIALFSQMPFSVDLVNANRKHFRYEWIWQKSQGTGFLNANRMPLKIHENILIFYDRLPTYNPQMSQGEPYIKKAVTNGDGKNYGKFERVGNVNINKGTRYPRSVLRFANSNHNSLHPTQKPVPLLEYLIHTYTNEGETVLDNCMGSGSTGVACLNTNRNFIGIELDNDYFNIAKERIHNVEMQKE